MKVRCYTISADRKVVDKTLPNTYTELTISNTSAIDLMNPNIIVEYSGSQFTYNYMYCDATGYYYYIDSHTVLTGGRVILKCSIDARKSLSSFIKNSMPCTIVRSAKGITQIYDSKLPLEPNKTYEECTQLNSPFARTNDGRRIMLGVFNTRS